VHFRGFYITTVVQPHGPCHHRDVPKVVDGDERRSTLIALTSRAIAQHGLANVTLRSIARSGGWTTGIATHYFADKRELIMATFVDLVDRARGRIETATAAGTPLLDAAVAALLPLDDERLTEWRVVLAYVGGSIGDDEMAGLHRRRVDRYTDTVAAALADEHALGRLNDGLNLATEAYRLVVLIHGIGVQAVLHPDRCPPEFQRRMVTEQLRVLGHPADLFIPTRTRSSRR